MREGGRKVRGGRTLWRGLVEAEKGAAVAGAAMRGMGRRFPVDGMSAGNAAAELTRPEHARTRAHVRCARARAHTYRPRISCARARTNRGGLGSESSGPTALLEGCRIFVPAESCVRGVCVRARGGGGGGGSYTWILDEKLLGALERGRFSVLRQVVRAWSLGPRWRREICAPAPPRALVGRSGGVCHFGTTGGRVFGTTGSRVVRIRDRDHALPPYLPLLTYLPTSLPTSPPASLPPSIPSPPASPCLALFCTHMVE